MWLSKKTGKNYRLMSESELECVKRAGTTSGPIGCRSKQNFGPKKFGLPLETKIVFFIF